MLWTTPHIPGSLVFSLSFIAGICHNAYMAPLKTTAGMIFALLILSLLTSTGKKLKIIVFGTSLALVALGSKCYQHQMETFDQFYMANDKNCADITGTISSIEITDHTYYKSRLTISLNAVKNKNQSTWKNTVASIFIHTSLSSIANLEVGDSILMKNLRFKKSKNRSFNNFLIKENCMASLFIPHLDYHLICRPKFSCRKWLQNYKTALLTRLQKKFSPEIFPIFGTILLGKRLGKNTLQYAQPHFKAWGIMHYLARSGLHLVFIIMLLYLLLNTLPIAFLAKQLMGTGIIVAYGILSWPSVPFNRALSLFIFQKVGIVLNCQIHTIHLLSCICLVTLFLNPILVFSLDFQLSFGLTLALAYFNVLNEKNYP